MKPRIEKKLSKKLHAILGNLIGEVWIDKELELYRPHYRHNNLDNAPLTSKQERENRQVRVRVNHMPSIGGGLDYWGEGEDWHSVLYVAREVLIWAFGEETDSEGTHCGYPLLKAKMTGIWIIKHAKLYAMQERVKAAKEACRKARIAQLKDGWYIQFQYGEGWVGKCICCERLTPIYCDVAEFDPNSHYCGGSPSCCP
ncbi:hypothetical protein [Aeromonas veronii]|uniref:hypothetical protein n=1 Tax=Aeromonas veronii TaxID=654 RepID=UPI0005A977E1|nr:hypothetical protein [Aeromonas veronii]MBS4689894.1 hypothetical protein [Aeromonas veronii bv. veronii]OKP39350.1 hypothetical protein BJP23_00385 [Aeromonas veronii bv. veronii]